MIFDDLLMINDCFNFLLYACLAAFCCFVVKSDVDLIFDPVAANNRF